MKIRPCIDIHNGAVKQIVGNSLRDGAVSTARENYVSALDAADYAAIYREKGLSGGHIILLNSVKEEAAYEADRRQALRALKAYPGGMQVGGGITPETAPAFLDAGASHVIVTSYVFRDGRLNEENLRRMIAAVGRDRLVLDLSCRRIPVSEAAVGCGERPAVNAGRPDRTESIDRNRFSAIRDPEGAALFCSSGKTAETFCYVVVTDRWQKRTDLPVGEETLNRLSSCCDEFLIHAADVEGRRAGIETDLVSLLGRWQNRASDSTKGSARGPIPVTYAGGVHALEDLKVIRKLSGDRMDVTVGSALDLFGGNLSLSDLIACSGEPL